MELSETEIAELRAQKRRRAITTYAVITLIAFAIGFVSGLGVAKKINPCVVVPTISIQRDTVTTIDTVKGQILPPVIRSIIKRDTIILPSKSDTSYKQSDTTVGKPTASAAVEILPDGRVTIPIEQKIYSTALYRAVVSGWRASLDSIEVYPKRTTITETVTKLAQPPRRNWAVTVGPSATYTVNKQFVPGASVVLGFVVKSWH